jgi:hypothetical protein
MAEWFRRSTTWVIDFRHDGHPRRWFRAFAPGVDVRRHMSAELQALYQGRAQLVEVRPATDDEESSFLRGDEPKNVLCPTGRRGPPDGSDQEPPR